MYIIEIRILYEFLRSSTKLLNILIERLNQNAQINIRSLTISLYMTYNRAFRLIYFTFNSSEKLIIYFNVEVNSLMNFFIFFQELMFNALASFLYLSSASYLAFSTKIFLLPQYYISPGFDVYPAMTASYVRTQLFTITFLISIHF